MPLPERDRTIQLAAIGGVVAWAGTVLPAALSRHRSEVPWIWWVLSVIILGAFVALADALVRPHPLDGPLVVVIVAASMGAVFVYGAEQIAPVFMVLTAGVAGWVVSTRTLILIGVVQVAALVAALALQGGTIVWTLVYAALMFFAGLMVRVVVREAQSRDAAYQTAVALAAANERLQVTNRELAAAQARLAEASKAQERLRISRDLHDSMGHQVTALALTLELIDRKNHPDLTELVAQARSLSSGLLRDVRGAVTQLRSGQARAQVRDDLSRWVRTLPKPDVALDFDTSIDDVPHDIADAIIRIVQEAVTNSSRHSTGDRVWVRVARGQRTITVTIRDDGIPGGESVTPGHGISGMVERAEAVGGALTWGWLPEGGFEIAATLPVPVPVPGSAAAPSDGPAPT